MQFPTITTRDLNGGQHTLPRDLEGEYNLLLLGYHRWHQEQIDSWQAAATRLEDAYPAFRYYELPVVGRMNLVSRFAIDQGMRAGIPSRAARSRVLTLYIDREGLNEELDIETTDEITLLLVARDGTILWRGVGEYTPDKAESLERALAQHARPAEAPPSTSS